MIFSIGSLSRGANIVDSNWLRIHLDGGSALLKGKCRRIGLALSLFAAVLSIHVSDMTDLIACKKIDKMASRP